ncbi:unnamed protein product [Orchesella dallaii]|uniref:Odorant receptor n=1 Tax=Orchesella dallaii TaxID=48710 RepID=A0ABP1PUS1_9HEXA
MTVEGKISEQKPFYNPKAVVTVICDGLLPIRGTMICNHWEITFSPNPSKKSWLLRSTEYFRNVFGLSTILFCCYHMITQQREMRTGAIQPEVMQAFVVNILVVSAITLSFASIWTTYTVSNWHEVYKELFTVLHQVYQDNALKWRGIQLDELLIYGVTGGIYLVPLCAAIFSLVWDNFPFNLMISTVFPFLTVYQVRMTSLVIGTSYVFIAMLITLVVLLDVLSYLSALKCLLPCTYDKEYQMNYKCVDSVPMFTSEFSSSLKKMPRLKFLRNRRLYLGIYLITINATVNTYYYVPTLIGVGIALSVALWYTMLRMLNVMPFLVYLSFSFDAAVLLALICLLSFLSEIPLKSSMEFRGYWKRQLTSKLERKQLKACPLVVTKVEPFFSYNPQTFGSILSTIVDYTTALLLNL